MSKENTDIDIMLGCDENKNYKKEQETTIYEIITGKLQQSII